MDLRSLEYHDDGDDRRTSIFWCLGNFSWSSVLKAIRSKLKHLKLILGYCCGLYGKDKYRRADEVDDDQTPASQKPNLRMVSGSFYIPKGEKSNPRGDDAHFICADEEAIGVADGVGGWARLGVDAGEYARSLMHNSAAAVRSSGPTGVDPKNVIHSAFCAARGVEGSSTACVVAHQGGALRAANVGDSGFMVFRRGHLLARSQPQQHGFNFPYQLGNGEEFDSPNCAAECRVSVAAGDVVVLGTDGLLDNLFPTQIEDIIGRIGTARPERLAREIAKMAYNMSIEEDCETPFARNSLLAGQLRRGGKRDDITVVVGVIVST